MSLAIDFDTDHGYKKPPAWHLWQLQKLGFKGHADVYMGVFWNNKRQRVGATTRTPRSRSPASRFRATWRPSRSPGPPSPRHRIRRNAPEIVSQIRAAINGMFAGVWANDGFGTSTTLRIQSKAPVVDVHRLR